MKILIPIMVWGLMVIMGGAVAATYEGDLKGEWSYKKIFTPSEIPLPASAQGLGAWNRAVYSPAVIKVNGTYFMLFGVSIYCQGGRVARDSIAIAKSVNGFDWQFWKYIIESDPKSCKEARGDWDDDQTHPFTYQTNDPAVYFNPNNSEEILVFYTTVKNYQDNYGHIGLAKYDKNWNQISRNDYYIEGTRVLGGPGFSRPTVNWLESGGPRLYFDSTFNPVNKIGSVKLDNLNQLINPIVRDENTPGVDIDVPNLDTNKNLLLSGGVWGRERLAGGSWGVFFYPIPLSGQGWDRDAQGSPQMFLEDDCRVKMYMSGTVMNVTKTDYEVINIGMAWPKDDRRFAFGVCKTNPSPTITKLLGDANGDGIINLVDFGIWKTEYLSGIKNKADFNKDGSVNLVDFGIWKKEYLN